MSTTDPNDALRAKRLRRTGDPRFLVAAIAVSAVVAVSAVLLGLAIAATAEMLRHFAIDSTFDDRVPFPTFWGHGTLGYLWTLGTAGTLTGSIAVSSLFGAYRGGEQQPRLLASLTACAIATAVMADAPTWLEPLQVGIKLDPEFHEDTPWSVFGWIAYYADIWFPGIVLLIAVLVVAHSIRHYRRLRSQIADRERLFVDGRRTKGVVTGVALRTTVNDQGQRSILGSEVTVKFTDHLGVERWVMRFNRGRAAIPAFPEVLFDPVRPGDDDLIFVSFHPDPTPPDWIGTPL